MLKIGNTTVKALYLGDRPIKRAYLGDKLVYEKKADSGIVKVPLPAGYTQVAYIESGSNQYIDTGIKPTATTKIVMDVEPTADADSKTKYFFNSAYINTSSSSYSYIFRIYRIQDGTKNGIYTEMGRVKVPITGIQLSTDLTKRRMTIQLDASTKTGSVDGVSQTLSNNTFSSSMNNMRLLTGSSNNIMDSLPAKLYSCQIYSGETITRDFVPCKDSSGVAGLYDVANSKFYKSANTTAFTAGPAV